MKYTNIRTKLNKPAIKKFQQGGIFSNLSFEGFASLAEASKISNKDLDDLRNNYINPYLQNEYSGDPDKKLNFENYDSYRSSLINQLKESDQFKNSDQQVLEKIATDALGYKYQQASNVKELFSSTVGNATKDLGKNLSGVNFAEDAKWRKTGLSVQNASIMGMASQAAVGATKMVDELTMGDKNFSAQSQAIDSAVHGVSGALLKSGNPYAMAAAAALEGANFVTKAGGQTIQGFDVDVNSSGYGDLGHMDSSSKRDFGTLIGLGGVNMGKIGKQLADRNEQAQMALKASNIAEEQKFETEARMNSTTNIINNNNIALNGGISTDLIGG